MTSLLKDVRTLQRDFRWGRRPLAPRNVPAVQQAPRDFPTAWARTPLARTARAAIQSGVMKPLIDSQTSLSVHGFELLDSVQAPVLFYANHSSHLDAPTLLCALPPAWRERTAIGAAADYFFDVWWRAAATALVFNAFPVERAGSRKSTKLAKQMIREQWNVLVFPEGTRSKDGWVGEFRLGASRLCIENQIPAVPIALRGTYQSMPRGRAWPAPGRRPVSVRFGEPIQPLEGELPQEFNARMKHALTLLLQEDRTSWWDALQLEARKQLPNPSGPQVARWRRMWESSEPVKPERPRVFR
ncbi:MAG: lysophospholipid acyltransferase family protein [Actinomycetota bacterium]